MSWLLALLKEADWGEYDFERQDLQAWEDYPLLVEAVQNLKREALFSSHIHGEGHIERVLLHGAMLAIRQGIDSDDVALLLDACCYHDTGRVDDSVDNGHGARSALKLAELTGRKGQDLHILEAMVEAHSRWDGDLEKIIERHQVINFERARRLALLLKDADGLDRVRLNDLDVKFLRWTDSAKQKSFAEWLFQQSRDWESKAKHANELTDRCIPEGLREAAHQFAVDGVIFPLKGGEGKTWCVGKYVFKPMGDGQQTDWICELMSGLEGDAFRVPRYKRTLVGQWTHDGWTCCSWLDGKEVRKGSDADWLKIMRAGCSFQQALSEQSKPAWMGKRYSIYTAADLIAWQEMPVTLLPVFAPLFNNLIKMANGSKNEKGQLIHGDLSGNVLLHPILAPGVIDFSPNWRPFLMGPATIVADALLWHQAGESLVQAVSDEFGQQMLPFIARGLAFRLAVSNLFLSLRGSEGEITRELEEYQRATTILDHF